MTMTLDSEKGTLGYQLNGKDLGQLFTGLEGKTLYPGLFLYNTACVATVLDASLEEADRAVPAAQFKIGSKVTLKGHKIYNKGSLACLPGRYNAAADDVLWYRLCADLCDLSNNALFDQIGSDGTTVNATEVSLAPTQLLWYAAQVRATSLLMHL